MTNKTLRLILGDQLNASHSWYQNKSDDIIYLIAELNQEASYVNHHIQKVVAFFSAMAGFANGLKQAGHQVLHLTLDDTAEFDDLPTLLLHLFKQHQITRFEYQLPDEYRLRKQLSVFCDELTIASDVVETEHFYLKDSELNTYFSKGKRHRLESFYRKLRKQFNLLMSGDEPLGGQWNFDADNRHKFKKADIAAMPEPLLFANTTSEITARLARHKINTIGTVGEQLVWPVNRTQANALLHFFCQHCLPNFGRFQDAMTGKLIHFDQDGGWSLYHSRVAFALNSKIISPQHVVNTAIDYFQKSQGAISLSQIEGFVRQILGWREFVRGIYWLNMPDYANANFFDAHNALPQWFWSGNTKMRCLSHAITQSLNFAYAHHIQRLMVTGNFCLLAGVNPDEVDNWYLGIYIDAIEWVEMPNTRGMSQFADGGIVGSKAYAASGNYIKKMSDYCGDCHYQVSETITDNACPLNALYWHFMHRNQNQMGNNPRTKMVYANWLKKSDEQRQAVLARGQSMLENLNQL